MDRNFNLPSVVAGTAIGAIAYWFQPYNETTFLGINIFVIMGTGALLAACLLQLWRSTKPLTNAIYVTTGVLVAVMLRILFDLTFMDATSHNLLPIEILFAGVVAFPGALLGALVVFFATKVRKARES